MRAFSVSCLALVASIAACAGSSSVSPTPPPARREPLRAAPHAAASASAVARATPATSAPACPAIDFAGPQPATPRAPPGFEGYSSSRQATSEDACGVADSNVAAVEGAILASAGTARPPATARPWNKATPPQYLDRVDGRFRLTAAERRTLGASGFVVLDRAEYPSFAWAYHDVYQSELPVYVSADSVLAAVFESNDKLVAAIEAQRLAPLTGQVIAAMECALDGAGDYPPEVQKDVRLYLDVAHALLDGSTPSDPDAARIVGLANAASGMVEIDLFGRKRNVDFTLYTPRGHYAKPDQYASAPDLSAYFRAATWLSRLELNLVSRSCRSSEPGLVPNPEETPREAVDALALADLAERAGALDAIGALDRAWALLGGKREDVSFADLVRLRKQAGIDRLEIPGSADELRAAIGARFQRTTRTHYMPEGSTVLPAIATMLGPRIVLDSAATRPLVHGEVPDRHMVTVADMAYAMGQDRAKAYLAADRQAYPTLDAHLDAARAIVMTPPAGDDLYSNWFDALRALSKKPEGALPSFMSGDAFADLRVGEAVAGFGQIRHNYVLVAAQSYDEGGCEIPDGFVEPVPALYDALLRYAARGEAALAELDPNGTTGAKAYFAGLAKVLRVLRAIVDDELAGRALSDDEKRFLSMVTEMLPGSSDGPPRYTGWYFDMHRGREDEALVDASFLADYFTSGWDRTIAYAGAKHPRLGVFVVDTGGGPRAVVGPVARGFGATGPLAKRLGDADALAVPTAWEPWTKSYLVAGAPAPPIALKTTSAELAQSADGKTVTPKMTIAAVSTRALGVVTLELLDHHHQPVQARALVVGTKPTKVDFVLPAQPADQYWNVSSVRVRVGEQTWWPEGGGGPGWPDYFQAGLGGMDPNAAFPPPP